MTAALLIKNAVLNTGPDARRVSLLARGGSIEQIAPHIDACAQRVLDADGALLLPGFIDLHTHGAAGMDMNAPTPAGFAALAAFFASQGVTGYVPTLLADGKERLFACIRAVNAARAQPAPGARILGIHLEGPWLSPAYRGAMPERMLRSPDIGELSEYVRAAAGCPLRITLAPELDGAPDLVRAAVRMGVSVSLGHSGATYAQTRACIDAGATAATHTFNAMRLPHQREPGVAGAALESDLFCEIICDGKHVHPAMLRLLLRMKGPERVIAVTDSIMATGLGDGVCRLGANEVVVQDGEAFLSGGSTRAGSVLTMLEALQNIVGFTGMPLDQAARLMTETPAGLMGLCRKGTLAPGMDADVTAVDGTGRVRFTVVAGRVVFPHCAA